MDRHAAPDRPTMSVFLADDNLIVREGVRALIDRSPDLRVVGLAADYGEVISGCAATEPQVLVTDVRMPPDFHREGIDAATEVRKRHPGTGWWCSLSTTTPSTRLADGHGRLRLPAQGPGRRGQPARRRHPPRGHGRHGARPRDRRGPGPAVDRPPRPLPAEEELHDRGGQDHQDHRRREGRAARRRRRRRRAVFVKLAADHRLAWASRTSALRIWWRPA